MILQSWLYFFSWTFWVISSRNIGNILHVFHKPLFWRVPGPALNQPTFNQRFMCINLLSTGTVFIRQNMTSTDVKFWCSKTVPALKELNYLWWSYTHKIGIEMKRKEPTKKLWWFENNPLVSMVYTKYFSVVWLNTFHTQWRQRKHAPLSGVSSL